MRLFRRFAKDNSAIAAVEFAMILPVFILLTMGCFEVTRLVLIHQKMARAAASMADLVAQSDDPLTMPQLNDLYQAAFNLMSPYDLQGNGRVIVSSLMNTAGAAQPKIEWQRLSPGAMSAISHFGGEGATASGLPAGLVVRPEDDVIVAEVFFNYTPILANVIYSGSQFYANAFNRVRNNNLITHP